MNLVKNTEVFVGKERYLEIIGFTSYAYITGRITKYSGIAGGRMRTLGEFIENFVYGKIAEEAFKLFLKNNFGLQTLTEVDIADFYRGVYLPDIVAMIRDGDFVLLNFWIDVKETRRDQRWLLIPASSIRQRPYDAYVAVWVGLPEEHMLWLVENVPSVKEKMSGDWLRKVSEIASTISKISCKVYGFALWDDVVNVIVATQSNDRNKRVKAYENITKKFGERRAFYFDGKTALFDPEDPSWQGSRVGENVGFTLKSLEKSSDWKKLVSLITRNRKIIGSVPLQRTKSGRISKKSGLPQNFNRFTDYRDASQAYLQEQLDAIKKRFGKIERDTSWFAQPLNEKL
jgi:hypothetical protein